MLHIQVYEQRALPDPVNRNLDRSYHLAMSHRGMGAVENVSLPYNSLSHAASCQRRLAHCVCDHEGKLCLEGLQHGCSSDKPAICLLPRWVWT